MSAAPVTAVIVVSFEDPADVRGTIESLLDQTRPPTQIVVVDNHPEGRPGKAFLAWGLPVEVVRPGENLGYPPACNVGAEHATQEWLFFLNPDADAAPECLERLLAAADERTAIVGAQILLPDGETVNAGDNPVHVTGLSWSGRYLEPRETGPPRDVACVSGAALITRTSVYRELGGHCPAFFLYVDDTDMAWRARMAGRRVVFAPDALVRHDYEFDKGARKWFWLEHNRIWMVLSNYRVSTLLLLAPLLLAAEAGIALQSRRDGWWPEKVRGWRTLASQWREVRAWRRQVQAHRTVPDAEILARHVGAMHTPLVESPLLERVNPWMEWYVRVVRRLAGARTGGKSPAAR